MKKKFTSKLKEKKGLPLSLYFLEKNNQQHTSSILKFEKAPKINSDGFELFNFYKVISKF
ncbi:hypothetical protein SAMN05660461_5353 [Chitinophaga ginsengisegetis]|uniref:Uncharacterized protein n=1 Tax=Chitinophaga ginsengisegetis TaxID=393003 RepID=A0A1T5P9Q5_9BACT|nr:hypothetical protein [Chitinophaga ginsengisegetis]MDR6569011.1 hypothetical protein [Chitinophaga ginsengisegetis]MDR6648960.1 hypothetical protein [Chitinophaga ginsengisegetis]MDR6655092.1 hypothetical protein [Chitinophaga ginsengisegetis]SKD09464.1 hypothetical protein SAMN05660461_5353 [Chitinophaga ginsengisegetis]